MLFDTYDNKEKSYEIIYSDKTKVECTAQELFEFFLLSETNIGGDFDDLKNRLDRGIAVVGGSHGMGLAYGMQHLQRKTYHNKNHSSDKNSRLYKGIFHRCKRL